MPYVIELDMAISPAAADATVAGHGLRPSDFRIHPGAENAEVHWLLKTVYGRDLLKAQLRKVRPDLSVPRFRHAEELDGALDSMIDLLGLRDWPAPRSVPERVAYMRNLLRLLLQIERDARATLAAPESV